MAVVLFDFFGTLVDYSPSRTEQGYHRTHARLGELGVSLAYGPFLARWTEIALRFDAASDIDDREFSMEELGTTFLAETLERPAAADEIAAVVEQYLAEWSRAVHPIEGVADLLTRLARSHRLAVVTNTHSLTLVPDQLDAMGVAHHFDAVISSVEVGWRKPHPAIYEAALAQLGASPADVVFVGDTRSPDYDGPRAMGMQAFLIDPGRQHDIPDDHRLTSVHDLADRL